ncbi:MAG: RNA polymerase sigma-70 factor [Algibacter sp.]|uniref:RNA polymerase sigma factor n=1 Tax=Algibacter sp. TaxID=1872428 RepID=UPI003299F916
MPYKPLINEKQLLACTADGDTLAFKQIFDHYRPGIYSLALKLLKSSVLAEDVVQDVFIKIWNKRVQFPQVINFRAYLYKTAKNQVFDEFKKIAKASINEEEPNKTLNALNDTDYGIRKEQLETLLEEALNKLPPQQKNIYQLSRNQGLTYPEIAIQLNLSPLTVKTHMKHILAFLRNHLSEYMELSVILFLINIYFF